MGQKQTPQRKQQSYWQKTGSSADEFIADRDLCREQAQPPNQDSKTDPFDACMNGRGWHLLSVTDAKGYSDALSAIGADQLQLCSRQDLAPIFAKKMPCRPKQATPEQLADRARISNAEKIAFMKWQALSEERNEKTAAIHRQYNAQTGDGAASLIKKTDEASAQLGQQLYDGRISWGEYNKKRTELTVQAEQDGQALAH
jgi:hypothetical protein